jgi:hypothetical protein
MVERAIAMPDRLKVIADTRPPDGGISRNEILRFGLGHVASLRYGGDIRLKPPGKLAVFGRD